MEEEGPYLKKTQKVAQLRVVICQKNSQGLSGRQNNKLSKEHIE